MISIFKNFVFCNFFFSQTPLSLFLKLGVTLQYLNGDVRERQNILKIVCSNFYYDGSNITIAIKKAFQPLVKIALLEKMGESRRNSNF